MARSKTLFLNFKGHGGNVIVYFSLPHFDIICKIFMVKNNVPYISIFV